MINISVLRSILFLPGNHIDLMSKAVASGADAILIDLEDSVSLNAKDEARAMVVNYFKNNTEQINIARFVRINTIKSKDGLKDLLAILESGISIDGLLLPKIESVSEVTILDSLFEKQPIPYLLTIESAVGLKNIYDLVACSPQIKSVCFGGGDFSSDIGATLAWEPMLHARSTVVSAAASVGIASVDVPYLQFHDADNALLEEEVRRVKNLGFTCKFAIHPKHVQTINFAFTPKPSEIDEAQKIMAAFDQAKENAFNYNGKMVAYAIIRKAKKVLAIHESLSRNI